MRRGAVAFGCVLALLVAGTAEAQDLSGTWLVEAGTSRVRIAPCGAARCGTIVWTAKAGVTDENNPDAASRGRPLVGVRMISDAKPDGDGWTGRLYNPLDGRTYTGKMRVTAPGRLQLSGCVLGGLICRSQAWSKVE